MKKIFTLFCLFFLLLLSLTFCINKSFSKYVIEKNIPVANINVDSLKPVVELIDVKNSNINYESYANSSHTITVNIKIIEKNISINNFTQNHIQFSVGDILVSPVFNSFKLISENLSEKIYEFSVSNFSNDGPLRIIIPSVIIEDKSHQKNDLKTFYTGITIDNTAPTLRFEELSIEDNKSNAYIYSSESLRKIDGWNFSTDNKTIEKTFLNQLRYPIQLTDFAQNSSEIYVSIKNASNTILEYVTYDDYSNFAIASSGEIAGKNTISSSSICKTESILVRLMENTNSITLQGRMYLHTYWKDGAEHYCLYSENTYYSGYNPYSPSSWFQINKNNLLYFNKLLYTQFGGCGVNKSKPIIIPGETIPPEISSQYLYGISSVNFKLNNSPDLSIVYQTYVKDIGWLQTLSDGEELLYKLDKPISAIRMNIIPKSEKQYLVDFWNRYIGTSNIN